MVLGARLRGMDDSSVCTCLSGVLILFSFNASRLSASWQGFTFAWYGMLVHDHSLITTAPIVALLRAVSTVLALCLGVSGVLGLEGLRGSSTGRH